MKKIWFALLFSIVIILASASTAFAVDKVADLADILTMPQLRELNDWAERISEQYKCDVVIVTLEDMDDDDGAYEWARYIYQEAGFGYGSDKSGVLLFLSMAGRDYALIAHGFGNTAFTDHGKDVMLDKYILPLLKDKKYYEACSAYLDKAEEYLRMARDGKPFDIGSDPESQKGVFYIKLAVTILLPLLIAWIVCSIWKRQMKTAVKATTAGNYIPEGGFKLTGQMDMFLYRTRTQTKIEKSSSSGGTTVNSKGFSGRSGKF